MPGEVKGEKRVVEGAGTGSGGSADVTCHIRADRECACVMG